MKRLTDYKAKLTVFTNDKDAQKAEQNMDAGVLPLPKTKKRCKVEPLTKAMKTAKIYEK